MDVSKLNETLRKIKKEIETIQESCNHKEKELKFIESKNLRWVCKNCDMPIGWPTEKERENWSK